METLTRQTIPVRVRHLETPESYLRRLCVANSIDANWLVNSLRQRRLADGRDTRDLGVAIAELGGPAPEHFEAAHAAALVGHANVRGPWDKQTVTRTACLSCTAGERVLTYPHVRFTFCRRHGQWLGDGTRQQRRGVLDAESWNAERHLRRMVARGLVNNDLIDLAWALVRDKHLLVDRATWDAKLERAMSRPGFIKEVDDRLAMFPETVRVLRAVARPEFADKIRSGRLDSTQRRAYLYRSFAWAGPERWVLCEGIDQYFNRDAE